MNTAVIGAGAVGLGLGSCLLAAGEPALFVVRAGSGAGCAHGLERTGVFGSVRVPAERVRTVEGISALAQLDATLDWVLVCTKTFESRAVAAELASVRREWERRGSPSASAAIVLFHNGWGSGETFAEVLPETQIWSARVLTGFRRLRPWEVEITVHAEPIRLGSLFGADHRRLAPLAAAVSAGGIPCETTPEIAKDLWAKLLYNCMLNPLGALEGLPYGELAEQPHNREIMEAVVREVFAVMKAAGYATHWPGPREYLRDFDAKLLPPTARHESSMLQDLRAGRRTEIEALCGAVVSLGERSGVAAPVNAALRDLIRAIEAKRRESPA